MARSVPMIGVHRPASKKKPSVTAIKPCERVIGSGGFPERLTIPI
jgi:hypothetical protein